MKNALKYILIAFVVILVLAVCAFVAWQNFNLNTKLIDIEKKLDEAKTAQTDTNVVKDNVIEWTLEEKVMSESTPTYRIDIKYPEMKNYPDAAVQTKFNSLIANFVTMNANDIKDIAEVESAGIPQIDLAYTVYFKSDKYVSVRLQGQGYYGGATSSDVIYSLNYDLKANSELVYSDMFDNSVATLNALSTVSVAKLTATFGEDLIASGASADKDNFKNMNFDVNGLTIKFDKYQVGPGAMGAPEISIAYSELPSGAFVLEL
jgi:hypothetical protein